MNSSQTGLNGTFWWSSISDTNVTFHNISSLVKKTQLTSKWTIAPIFSLITLVLGFFGNGSLLIAFAKDPSLRTPFSIYLINLLIANLICIILEYPLDIVANLYSGWFLGEKACTAYLYGSFVIQAAVFNAHQLIALNRMWAAVHPISYRTRHSVRTAVLLCLVMWVYVHLAIVPEWIEDAINSRLPVESHGCLLNKAAQPVSGLTTQLLIYDLPLAVMLMAFPVIYFSRVIRRRSMRRNNAIVPTVASQSHEVSKPGSTMRSRVGALAGAQQQGASGSNAVAPASNTIAPVKKVKTSHGYLVLALLTISVSICWTPSLVFYTVLTFIDIFDPTYYIVVTILFSCQTMLDPLLFTMALPSLRESLSHLFSCA
jgi:hypothetical protein